MVLIDRSADRAWSSRQAGGSARLPGLRRCYGPPMLDLTYRDATVDDLSVIVQMYADDDLGQTRERPSEPLTAEYLDAFRQIEVDPRHRLVVAEHSGEIVGTLQLSFLPHLVLVGGERAQIEAVRVRSDRRRDGFGEALFRWAIDQARLRGCRLIQLTTNADRADAQRFYERLGFRPTHVGMKLELFEG